MTSRLPSTAGFDDFDAAALGARLRELGLDREWIRAHSAGVDTLWSPLTPSRTARFDDSPRAAAFRLLFCAMAPDDGEPAHALGAALAESLERCGFFGDDGRAVFHLRTAGGVYLFSDFIGASEAVMGAGHTTALLHRAAMPRERIGSALDLGCGAGTLALLLAARADRVVATDISPRAIEFTRLNARINGITNVEARTGSLYEPVRGETFDLIVSQPPYYPDADGERATLLHGGPRGDEIAIAAIEGLPARLTARGRGLVFAGRTATPVHLPESRVLEITGGHREPSGAEQTLTVVERSDRTQRLRASVHAHEWGSVGPEQIAAMMAAQPPCTAPG